MATYAALASLMSVLDQIKDHPRVSNCFDKKQLESLSHLVGFLLDFVEITHSHVGVLSEEYGVLEIEITSAAYAAEDVIESHVVEQIHSGLISLLDLQSVIEVIDSVKDKVVDFKKQMGFKLDKKEGTAYSLPAPPSTSSSNRKSKMVEFDEELIQLLDALTGRQSSLQIIPIVGMGGIGKTTLARNAYESRLILNHFDIRAWGTISQEYSLKKIFSKLLSGKGSQSADEQQLAQQLYQYLIGRRYLIILDDVWSIDAWEKMVFFFPDNKNGSRIIITTRLSNVSVYFGSSYFSKKFLDEDKSWNLFCEKAFPQEEVCPPQLEEIGKKITKKCKGHPLLIVLIGGLLRKSSCTQEYWENISQNMNSILDSEEQNLDILSLSYRELPAHLKPCFLYTGIFPEDYEIHLSELSKLWIAEGFIKPSKNKSLEEVAEGYLKDLVERNLLSVGRLRLNGQIKTCTIHDLIRDLCIKTAEKEKFFYFIRFCDSPRGIIEERRILFLGKNSEINYDLLSHALESAPLNRSLLRNAGWRPFKFRLLKVFNVDYTDSPLSDIFEQINLRYVWIYYDFYKHKHYSRELPWTVSLLWNVQTLKIGGFGIFYAPIEIWSMPQLRYLEFARLCLPAPPLRSQKKDEDIVLKNLHTLKTAVDLNLSEEVCKRIPNVKILKIKYNDFLPERSSRETFIYNIGCLHKLESLNCQLGNVQPCGNLVRNLKFPTSLKKLTLSGRKIEWEDLTTIGSSHNLEVLQLKDGSMTGSEWNPVEGEFLRLKYLFIDSWELKHWNAESFHFPVLEKLYLSGLLHLDEIPSGIGEIPTLALIHLLSCSESAAMSAMSILEEQESFGNDHLRVVIQFRRKMELERFTEKVVNFECFNSNNLQLQSLVD
ncbi:hypothetical protein ABFS83_04G165300 [Erythranthe nasuta]